MTESNRGTTHVLKPLRRLAIIRSSNVDKVKEDGEEIVSLCNYVDVYYNDRITADIEFSQGSAKPQEIKKFGLKAGDVVITKDSETPDDIAVPALVESSAEGVVCGYHLAILRPITTEVYGPYLFWSLKSKPVREAFGIRAQGITRYGLTLGGIASVPIPTPDFDTQKGISAFLDRETGRVDQLIENKTLFIQTLQEKRQALITYAVTEGLNPNVKMKDRGTATEGERRRSKDVGGRDRQSFERGGGVNFWPEKSREMLRPLKRVCALNPEVLPESTNPEFEFEYIDIGSVTLEGGIVARETMKFANAPSRARKPVKSGDVIISTVRTYLKALALIGPNAEDWIVSTGFAVLRSNSEIDPQFLYYAVQSNPFIESIVAASSGVSYPAINPSTLGSLPISCPHIDVQKAIADFLDRETARIDVLVRKTKRSIDLLKERRSAFITAAVTGQIDIAECKEHKQTDGQLEIIQQEAMS